MFKDRRKKRLDVDEGPAPNRHFAQDTLTVDGAEVSETYVQLIVKFAEHELVAVYGGWSENLLSRTESNGLRCSH
jgi:hypothetical protein